MIELRHGRGVTGDTATYVGPDYQYIELPLLDDTDVTDVMFCPWCRDLFIQADIVGLSSADEITIVVEGSLDNVSYDDLMSINDPSATPEPIVISTNGCTLLYFRDALPPYVRVRVIDATGVLEDATIELKAYMQSIS